ncbi:MAG: RNA pseudouridine synthase [Cyclobacteriaceae bacterium]
MSKRINQINFEDIILHQDKDYTVVNKPPHLSSLKDRNDHVNLLKLAKEQNPDAQVCHRLDKETSGALVIANHNDAYKHFAGQLQNREVKKVYHAILNGLHNFEDFEADEPLYTTSNKSRVDFRNGKPSLTLFQTLEVFKKHTLVKCFPVTGRMHQIRAHLAHHGATIVNDEHYGGSPAFLSQLKKNFSQKKWEEEKPIIHRFALHAYTIAFRDLSGLVLETEAPYFKDFDVLVRQLRKYN